MKSPIKCHQIFPFSLLCNCCRLECQSCVSVLKKLETTAENNGNQSIFVNYASTNVAVEVSSDSISSVAVKTKLQFLSIG
jgi:hypothetical protein